MYVTAVAGVLAAVVLALVGPAVAGAAFSPASGSPFAAGASPQGVAAGDFNGDGREDVAVAGSSGVSVLLADAAGNLTAAPGSPYAAGPMAGLGVVAGDFDGDGALDLASGEVDLFTFTAAVSVLLGDGSGGFAPAAGSPFSLGSGGSTTLNWLTAADFDGDGDLDVAGTGDALSGEVFIGIGDGSGGFTAAPGSPHDVDPLPWGIVTADFNGDGKADLATANASGGSVSVLLGDGSGGFGAAPGSPVAVGNQPTGVAAADFDADGNIDLAVSNFDDQTVSILLGDGAGGFSGSPLAAPGGPVGIVAADFDGTGSLDLAYVLVNSDQVAVMLGDGSGGFAAAPGSPYPVGDVPQRLAAADLDGNGTIDLVNSNANSSNVSVLLGSWPPGPPAAVSATAGNGQATVTWSPPVWTGGVPITSYTVTAAPGGQTCTWTGGPLTCTITGLTNAVGYTFTVTATNALGTGPPSAASAAATPLAPSSGRDESTTPPPPSTTPASPPRSKPKPKPNIEPLTPRLRLRQTADRSRVRAGQMVAFTITVANVGRGAARRVRVCSELPTGLAYLSSQPQGTLSKGRHCWTVATLGVGKRARFTVRARALNGAGGVRSVRASATARGSRTMTVKRAVRVIAGDTRGGGVTG